MSTALELAEVLQGINLSIEALRVALFLSLVARTLVQGLVRPIWERYKLDKFWLTYIAWGASSGIVALGQVNVFETIIPSHIAGVVLTCALVGGGSNVLHDLLKRVREVPG